jgi:hypothetical protein
MRKVKENDEETLAKVFSIRSEIPRADLGTSPGTCDGNRMVAWVAME